MQPPAQELVARDLHDNGWTFRHIYRGITVLLVIVLLVLYKLDLSNSKPWFLISGQPKRHLLTTGWSLFVSGKRLFAGDSVLFIR